LGIFGKGTGKGRLCNSRDEWSCTANSRPNLQNGALTRTVTPDQCLNLLAYIMNKNKIVRYSYHDARRPQNQLRAFKAGPTRLETQTMASLHMTICEHFHHEPFQHSPCGRAATVRWSSRSILDTLKFVKASPSSNLFFSWQSFPPSPSPPFGPSHA
jgi:hypothetical protein